MGRVSMKHFALILLMSGALFLGACGGGLGAPKAPATPATGGTLRALNPADLNMDGIPDAPVPSALRRLLLQTPADFALTRVSLTRGPATVEFTAAALATRNGDRLVELSLKAPLGEEPVTLRAGAYELRMFPVALPSLPEAGFRPATGGALANDLVSPTAAVFDAPADVQLLCLGALPSAVSGLRLACGDAPGIELQPTITSRGLMFSPLLPLQAGRAYRLVAADDARDCFGRALTPRFNLWVRRSGIVALANADLDRDGQEELLFLDANGLVNTLADPAGQPQRVPLGVSGKGEALSTGDFDGNGVSDIAVLVRSEEGFSLLKLLGTIRNGRTDYSLQSMVVTLEAPQHLASGDFDRDGKDDLVLVGAFGQAQFFTSRLSPRSLESLTARQLVLDAALVDADADGDLDLFLLAAGGQSRLLVNRGTEGLGDRPELRDLPTGAASRVAFADFETNAHLDLLLSGALASCRMRFDCFGEAGSMEVRRADESGLLAGAVLCRDLNSDNRADLIAMREDESGVSADFAVFVNFVDKADNRPDGLFSLQGRLLVHAVAYWRGTIALATESMLYLQPLAPIQVPLRETSKARFIKAYEPMPALPAPLSAAIADFNGDGKSDVASLDADGRLTIWLAGAAGEKFSLAADGLELGGQGSLQVVDFDRDSLPDLLFVPTDRSQRPRLLRGTRDGRFEDDLEGLLPTPPTNLMGAPAMGDFDRDGRLDVLWPNDVGRLQFNEGGGRWREFPQFPVVRDATRPLYFSGDLCCADFTGDGLADVVAVMQPFEASAFEQCLVLLEGTGQAEMPFNVHTTLALRGRFISLTPAPLSPGRGAGLALGFARVGENLQFLLLGLDGQRQFASLNAGPDARGELAALAADDIDRDGDLDLILVERQDGTATTTLWVNMGDGRFTRGTSAEDSLRRALGNFAASNLSLADFTGDGKPDLLAIDSRGNVVLVRTAVE